MNIAGFALPLLTTFLSEYVFVIAPLKIAQTKKKCFRISLSLAYSIEFIMTHVATLPLHTLLPPKLVLPTAYLTR